MHHPRPGEFGYHVYVEEHQSTDDRRSYESMYDGGRRQSARHQ